MVQEGRGHRKLTAFLVQVKRFLLVLERIGVLLSDGADGTRSELKAYFYSPSITSLPDICIL